MVNPFLVGEKIYLRGLKESDLGSDGAYFQWFNDQEVCAQNSHGRFPNTEAKMRAYFSEITESKTELLLAIVTKDDDRHVGNVALQNIHWIDRSAEFSIILGEKECWGKGLAKEAIQLILKHGFLELNLNRVHCGTTNENIAMQKLAKHAGMREEGRRYSAVYRSGKYLDVLLFGILREEFLKSN